MRYIQTLLGHNSLRATEIYTHVVVKGLATIKNRLDLAKIHCGYVTWCHVLCVTTYCLVCYLGKAI
nr:hypothetical protein [Reichenbachiella sp. MSK19-1]